MNRVVLLMAGLLLSFGLRVWLAAAPVVPSRQPFASFPRRLGQWELAYEGSIEARLEPVLGADDYTVRRYRNPAGESAELFTAYYNVQQAGEAMHSPKNCLGGAGWEPIQRGRVRLGVDAAARPAVVNSFIIEKDGERSVVLYWYQVQGRIIASEYWVKAYSVWAAVRNRRRDGAVVRISVPISSGGDGTMELKAALDLARTTLLYLPRFLPA
jgi:EpsI family protein